MTREEILQEVLQIPNKNKLLMLSTGVGKTLMAIKLIEQIQPKGKILIVIPRLVLIQNWKDEFIKWGYEKYLPQVEFVTYVSLPKKASKYYEIKVLDEAHHLSERCLQAIPYIKSEYNILLSATIKRTLIPTLQRLFFNLYIYRISLQEAIKNEILPEPRIILIPLQLETTQSNEIYQLKPKAKEQKDITYLQWSKGKFKYLTGNFSYGVRVHCTQKQKNTEFDSFIANCTKRINSGAVTGMKRIMIEQARKQTGLKRLQWLAEIKSDFVKQLLKQLKNYRTLTFCYNIKQADYLSKNSIHSKNHKAKEILESFNNNKIKHITAIDCLTEGINLAECKILLFAKLDASLIKQAQKQGRGLRYKKPVFILPYYVDTKEEQIVQQMIEGYDSSLIVKATNPFNFNEYINKQ
jgi:superfamily II DNA or RNA helicase